jgi:outer membrane protein TolC
MNLPRLHVNGIFVMLSVLAIVYGGSGRAVAQSPSADPTALDQIKVLDLETAAKMALEANPSLAAARARLDQARQAVRQARSAYWPTLDLEASAARVDLSENDYQYQSGLINVMNTFTLANTTLEDPENHYSLDLTARWIVFDGFARKFNLAAAKCGEQGTAAAQDEAQRLLLSALANAFLSAQLARENMAIAQADVKFNERLLTEARLRYDVGTGALSDVLNFQVKANSALTQHNQAERDLRISQISLAALIGFPQAVFPEHMRLAELEPVKKSLLEEPRLPHLLETSAALRPDLLQSARSVDLAEARVGAATAKYYPTVALSATWSGERSEDADFESDDFGNTVAVGLSYSLFAGGLHRARRQEARAQWVEAQKKMENDELTIASEVRTTTARVRNAQRQLVLQQTNAELVRKNRDLVEKEYKAGVGSLVRLNEAQRDLTAAHVRLASARVTLLSAWIDLQTATGEILQRFKP